jgi:hypothetical protein
MLRMRFWALICVAIANFPSLSAAQFPPEKTKNLKVLPPDIPMRALIDTMAGFTRALGVRCTYCHIGKESEPLSAYDFVSDEKPEKLKAREMLRMLSAINGDHLAKLPSRREPRINVSCATCHRGIAQPRPLQQVLLMAYDAGGADSVEAGYRALRQRYYGAAAYDFGEVPLVDVANAIRGKKNLPDALRIYTLNTQVSPTSTFALRSLGGAQVEAGDTAAAVGSYQRALAINPNDQQSKAAIGELTHKAPK